MIFVFPITIPPLTPVASPVVTPLPLMAGTITHASVQFPLGVTALAHLRIKWGLHQLFPTNAEADFATSNETIGFAAEFVLDQPPFALTAEAWNLDDTYPHTLTVRIIIARPVSASALAAEIAALLSPVAGGA